MRMTVSVKMAVRMQNCCMCQTFCAQISDMLSVTEVK